MCDMRLPDDEDMLDSDFPLGDERAETGATVYCPYCNETVEIVIDPGGGSAQEYVEDCEICCQPWSVSVQYREDGTAKVSIEPLDEEVSPSGGRPNPLYRPARAAFHSGSRIE